MWSALTTVRLVDRGEMATPCVLTDQATLPQEFATRLRLACWTCGRTTPCQIPGRLRQIFGILRSPINWHPKPFAAESEDFRRAKNAYSRKAELLQHIVEQQRTRLEQISTDLQRTSKEASYHILCLVESCLLGQMSSPLQDLAFKLDELCADPPNSPPTFLARDRRSGAM